MFFSILIAVYNREKYIEECLQSCINQSFSDFEIIIVDDGSTDNTVKIIETFDDDRIKLYQQVHFGCWKTKNATIKKASGKFVVFIDSDDYVSADYLLKLYNSIINNPNFDYYYPTSLVICDEAGTPTNNVWKYLAIADSERWKIIHTFFQKGIGIIPHAGAAINRNIFAKVGYYNEDLFNFSDTEYILRNAETIRYFPLNSFGNYYNRQHQFQTNKNTLEKTKSKSYMLDMIIQKYPKYYLFPESRNKQIAEKEILRRIINLFMSAENASKHKGIYANYAKKYIKELRKI